MESTIAKSLVSFLFDMHTFCTPSTHTDIFRLPRDTCYLHNRSVNGQTVLCSSAQLLDVFPTAVVAKLSIVLERSPFSERCPLLGCF